MAKWVNRAPCALSTTVPLQGGPAAFTCITILITQGGFCYKAAPEDIQFNINIAIRRNSPENCLVYVFWGVKHNGHSRPRRFARRKDSGKSLLKRADTDTYHMYNNDSLLRERERAISSLVFLCARGVKSNPIYRKVFALLLYSWLP